VSNEAQEDTDIESSGFMDMDGSATSRRIHDAVADARTLVRGAKMNTPRFS
jgi:hypothetical protein